MRIVREVGSRPNGGQDKVAELAEAARLFGDTGAVLTLAVEALAQACPHGLALAFVRRWDGSIGEAAAALEGQLLARETVRRQDGPVSWVVDLDRVPTEQQNRWIEPIAAGVHGADYFRQANPLPMALLGAREPPDYGRVMVCRNGRMLGWLGIYADSKRGFSEGERQRLIRAAADLTAPLRLAALLESPGLPIRLSPRQSEIMERVARGMTNKQIANELGISPSTVKTVLERLFRLSRTDNRTALVQWWRSPSFVAPSR
jgi:DNA-binding CsgD family transcriptional regulator